MLRPLAIWLKNRTETFLEIFAPPQLPFPECLTSHRFAAASNATFGREQRYLRPRVARTAAASSTNSGRRVDNFSLSHEGGTDRVVAEICRRRARLPAANARREDRPGCLIPPVAKRCYPRPFPFSHHAPSALLFLLFIILQPTKRKINF